MLNLPWEGISALQKRAFMVMLLGVNSNFHFWGEGITKILARGRRTRREDHD
jgi:hypothetical protein